MAAKGDEQVFIHNPVFVIKGWGTSHAEIAVNSEKLARSRDYRIGYKGGGAAANLIIWLNRRFKNATAISIVPVAWPR